MGCEYGYKPINNSTYIQHINNLKLTAGTKLEPYSRYKTVAYNGYTKLNFTKEATQNLVLVAQIEAYISWRIRGSVSPLFSSFS